MRLGAAASTLPAHRADVLPHDWALPDTGCRPWVAVHSRIFTAKLQISPGSAPGVFLPTRQRFTTKPRQSGSGGCPVTPAVQAGPSSACLALAKVRCPHFFSPAVPTISALIWLRMSPLRRTGSTLPPGARSICGESRSNRLRSRRTEPNLDGIWVHS